MERPNAKFIILGASSARVETNDHLKYIHKGPRMNENAMIHKRWSRDTPFGSNISKTHTLTINLSLNRYDVHTVYVVHSTSYFISQKAKK